MHRQTRALTQPFHLNAQSFEPSKVGRRCQVPALLDRGGTGGLNVAQQPPVACPGHGKRDTHQEAKATGRRKDNSAIEFEGWISWRGRDRRRICQNDAVKQVRDEHPAARRTLASRGRCWAGDFCRSSALNMRVASPRNTREASRSATDASGFPDGSAGTASTLACPGQIKTPKNRPELVGVGANHSGQKMNELGRPDVRS